MYFNFPRVWNVLENNNKTKVVVATLLLFFSSIFDLVGVASVLPFLSVLADPDLINRNIYLIKLKSILDLDKNQFIVFLGLASFSVIIINQLLRLFSKWYTLAFSENLLFEKSKNLFHFYLQKPYKYFLSQNTANLIQKCTNYVNATVAGYMTPLLLIIGNVFNG